MKLDINGGAGEAGATADGCAAAECWVHIQEEIVRGIAHAMGNRVATLSAGLHLLRDRTVVMQDPMLQSELDLLERLLVQLRELAGDTTQPEALLATDSARTAIALCLHHGRFRDRTVGVDDSGAVPPVRAVPAALMRAIIVALVAAGDVAGNNRSAQVTLSLASDDDVVRITATADARADSVTGVVSESAAAGTGYQLAASAISWLLGSSGGRGLALGSGCVVEVPTLAASRRMSG